jgi:hypothetical protein
VSARSGKLVIFVATLAATHPTLAQSVRGTLRDSATREPIPGAVVTITDSVGAFLARSISDEVGRFSVARLPPSRRMHAIRIGYRPFDGAIPADPADSAFVSMVAIPSLLAPVSALSRRVCPGDKTDAGALDLWEQARAALLAGVVVRESRAPRARLRSFWRQFDPVRRRLVDDSVWIKEINADRSYVAARPAWAFADEGYMRESLGGDREYFAPDDAVLLDPTFVATHCLHSVPADAAHPAQVGIAFEPVEAGRPDTLVEVAGVLWMDQAKPALRSLEFRYTNLESYAKESGGLIHFSALPNGAPVIDRWSIHTSLLAIDRDDESSRIRRRPPPRPIRTNVRLLGYQEVGGEVAYIGWNDGSTWAADPPHVSGVVTDTLGRRVVGARVWMLGSRDTTTSGADGTFRLNYTFSGTYYLIASDSVLAPMGISRTVPAEVRLTAPANRDVWLTLYPRSMVLPLTCPARSYKPGTGVLVARVVDSTGAPVASARIEIEASQAIVAGDTLIHPRRGSGESGDDGRFVICGAALDQKLAVRATKNGKAASGSITAWKDDVLTMTLVLKDARP